MNPSNSTAAARDAAEAWLSGTLLPTALLLRHAHEIPDLTALIEAERSLTYAGLLEQVRAAAAVLEASGVRAGDRVVIASANRIEYPVVANAVFYLGGIVVPLNSRLTEHEFDFLIGNSRPTVVVADAQRAALVTKPAAATGATLLDITNFWDGAAVAAPPPPVVTGMDDDQVIMYTSGTTGLPKGAVMTCMNQLMGNIRTVSAWGMEPQRDVAAVTGPLFHVASFNLVQACLYNGTTALILPSSGFSAPELLDTLAKRRVTHVFLVPTQWAAVIREQQRSPRDVSALRFCGWGAAPATESLLRSLQATFPGARTHAAFGQTEGTGLGISMEHEDALTHVGAVGKPDWYGQVRVVDADDRDVPPGVVGEILYRSPGVMDRYWENPEATSQTLRGGWLHSGDLVKRDEDGFVYVVDRLKDMIVSGGENIYCQEVENAIAWHPAVAEVSVIGRKDEKWGEVPVAVVVPVSDAESPTLQDIRNFCVDRLARFKLPRELVVREELPRSAAGKILKTELRKAL